jgi:hypothetical protein
MCNMRYFENTTPDEIGTLIGGWRERFPEMGLLAMVAEQDRETIIPMLQGMCRNMSVPLCGAVFPALVAEAGFHSSGCLLLRLDVMPFTAIYDLLASSHPMYRKTIERIADDVTVRLDRTRGGTLFMIFDSMVANIATTLDDLYLKFADRLRFMGANAGSETFRPMPCLFDNERQAQNGALVLLLPDCPGAVTEHCYQAPERMISATSTEGNRIISIDWRPAFEVYQEFVETEYKVKIDRDNFYKLAVHFPLGILLANNEIIVRMPVALEEDGSVFCVGEVPANSLLTLLRAPGVDSLQTVDKLAHGLHELYGQMTCTSVLTFYCAGRRLHLGERSVDELAGIQHATGAMAVAGALSLGEIGHSMQWGYPCFHNGALVCAVWGSQ